MRRGRARVEDSPPAAPQAPSSLPPWRGWGWLVPAGIALALLGILGPAGLLRATTPAGFDMAAHVYPLWRAVTHTLPAGRLHGWDTGWFGGFPFYFFYFPLTALLVAALTPATGFLVAVKLVSVLGILALPFAVMWLLREMALGERAAAVALPVALAFSVCTFNELGGNLASTLAGEFSYGLSFSLSLAYLASLMRAWRRQDRLGGVLPGVLLGLAALAHVLTVFMVVLVTAPALLRRPLRGALLASWAVGFAVSAWWAVPFVLRLPYSYGVPVPYPLSALTPPYLIPLLPLALLGALRARGQVRHLALPLGLGVLALVLFVLPQSAENGGRALPYWYFGICLGAGLAAALFLERALSGGARANAAVTALAFLPLIAAVPAAREYRAWASWDYSGLEAKPAWQEVTAVVRVLNGLPPGRVYWEHDWNRLAPLGSVNLFTLLPYWSPSHPALRGLWQQSSRLTPAVDRVDAQIRIASQTTDPPARGARWQAAVSALERLGVRYFIVLRPASGPALAQVPGVRALAATAHLALFALPATALVRRADGGGGIGPVAISEEEIRFHTAAPGRLHLVAVPFFPNWTAVTGAGQPRSGPDGLMAVVPTGPEVRLAYRTGWPERLGGGLSAAGLLGGLVVLALGRFRAGGRGAGRPASVVEGSGGP